MLPAEGFLVGCCGLSRQVDGRWQVSTFLLEFREVAKAHTNVGVLRSPNARCDFERLQLNLLSLIKAPDPNAAGRQKMKARYVSVRVGSDRAPYQVDRLQHQRLRLGRPVQREQ